MASEQTGQKDFAGLPDPVRSIAQYEPFISKHSRRASFKINGTSNRAEDLAQDMRTYIVRAVNSGELQSPAAIPTIVKNALINQVRFERSRIRFSSADTCKVDDPKLALRSPAKSDRERANILSVSMWLLSVPALLGKVFDLLYCG